MNRLLRILQDRILRYLLGVFIIITLANLLSACSALSVINTLTPRSTYSGTTDVAYGAHSRQQLDIFRPNSAHHPAPPSGYPVVVFFYGGSWNFGKRIDYRFIGEALAARGILTIVADYRLYPEVRYPDFLDDCAQAVAWVYHNLSSLGADPKKLYLMGHSAGAYNVAMLSLDQRWLVKQGLSPAIIRGWVGLSGPYDFLPIQNALVKPVFFHPNYPLDSQPINYVSRAAPRVFLGVSVNDDLINPQRNTKQLAEKLQELEVEVVLKEYPRSNHITIIAAFFRMLRLIGPVLDDVVFFVKE